jgi:hypothetical protein
MLAIHFPYIEAGRVRPVCGGLRANVEWTTAPEKVTCPRCKTLLRSSDSTYERSPRRAIASFTVPRAT